MTKPSTILFFISYLIVGLLVISCQGGDEEPPLPLLDISTSQLIVDGEEAILTISNPGNLPVNWTLNSPNEQLSISPYTGTLQPGENVEATVTVFKDQLAEGIYEMTMDLTTDKEIFYHIRVHTPVFEEKRWKLDDQLIDAAYDLANDRIVAVTDKSTLVLIDPFSQETEYIQLSFPALCVSVSPDGQFATVGHIAAFSRVDLNEKKVVLEQGLPIELFDLVEGADGWVYINPAKDINRSVYHVNWITGEQGWAEHSEVYANSHLKIDPNGKYLYSMPINVSPPDVIKMDIESGKTEYIRDSPYHGDYHFGSDFWISADSERLFANSGNVFFLSENPVLDLTYYGKLQGGGPVRAVSQQTSSKKIVAIHEASYTYPVAEKSFVALYSPSLELLEKIYLPDFYYQDINNFYHVGPTEILYGFLSSDDSKYVIVSKSDLNAPNLRKFGIQVVNID